MESFHCFFALRERNVWVDEFAFSHCSEFRKAISDLGNYFESENSMFVNAWQQPYLCGPLSRLRTVIVIHSSRVYVYVFLFFSIVSSEPWKPFRGPLKLEVPSNTQGQITQANFPQISSNATYHVWVTLPIPGGSKARIFGVVGSDEQRYREQIGVHHFLLIYPRFSFRKCCQKDAF